MIAMASKPKTESGTTPQTLLPPEKIKKIQILIIEDDEDTRGFLDLRLKKIGFKTLLESDGEKALNTARKKKPDLIILDLMLPNLPGEEICRSLKLDVEDELNSIPIIMLTAKDKTTDQIYGKVIGANAYITKPFEFADLLEEINRCLAGHHPES